MPGLDVFGQHMHAAHEILALGGKRLAQQFRIGQHEIRRRDRVGDLLDVERSLRPRVLIDAGSVRDQPFSPLHAEQIDLSQEIEELVLRPLGIGETLVLRVRGDDAGGLFAGHALGRVRPQFEKGAAEAHLQFERAFGIG